MANRFTDFWTEAKQFVLHDVWDMDLQSMTAKRGILVRAVRVVQLVIKGFKEDDLAIHASALTFVTLMSLVPMLAVAFAVLKGFGFGQTQINSLLEWKDSMPEQLQEFLDNVLNIVNTTNFSALGWVGVGFFIFTAVMVLTSVETSFNRIWGIARSRTVVRQAANYVSVLVLVPLLIGVAVSLTASLRAGQSILPEAANWVVRNLLQLTSLFTAWLAFWCLYVFVPNTRVRALPALASSLVGALLFLGWQKIYISLQVGVARYNAIYGTFASVPIFLAWLYVSWVIVLLGAELSFAFQNSATYQLEGVSDSASPRARLVLALSILRDAAHSLRTGAPRFETSAYARAHRVPIRLINHLVRMCVRHGLLAETAERQGIYVLLRAPDSVCLREIVDLVLQEGAPPETLGLLHLDPAIDQVLTSVDNGLNQSLETLTLNHLLHAAAPAAQGPHVPPAQT